MWNSIVKTDQIANATKWSAITNAMKKLISPVTNMVLARLLTPEIFGVVATINMVISFTDLFTDAGFQKYIVQNEFKSKEELYESANVAFWTNLSFSVMLWIGIALFREPLAALVGSRGYGLHLMIAALSIPMLSFSSIQQALFRRDFDYKSMFVARLVNALIPVFVTIPLAYFTRGCWSLIIGTLTWHVTDAVILTIKSKWKPKLAYSFDRLKEMLPFTIWTMFESFAIWLTLNIDVFILGKLLQPYYLGLYKTASTSVSQITNLVSTTIIPILFAVLSRNQHDKCKFENTLYSFQRMCGLLLIPMSIGIYVYRDVVTWVLLGSQWMEATRFIGLLGLTQGIMILISNFASEVYRAQGEPKTSAFLQIIYIVIAIPILYRAGLKGFDALCVACVVLRGIFALMHLVVLRLKYDFRIRKMIQGFVPAIIASMPMAIVGIQLNIAIEDMLLKLISIVICVMVYGAICLIMPNSRNIFLGIVKKRLE